MTRYYCKNCGSVFEPGPMSEPIDEDDSWICPSDDRHGCMELIPDHETIFQWEARTGQKYPNTAPVYYCTKRGWRCSSFYEARLNTLYACVVATEAGAPPDDWRPEEK